jgi:hypothetical protein
MSRLEAQNGGPNKGAENKNIYYADLFNASAYVTWGFAWVKGKPDKINIM